MAKTDKKDIPRACAKFIEDCEAKQAKNREEALRDLRFYAGEQWDPKALEMRKDAPCLVFNRLPAFVAQVVGDQRQNEMSIKIAPVDGGADKGKAEILEGLIRQIEYSSKADECKARAFQQAVISGFPGYLRVLSRYTRDDVFEQELVIRHINNPFSVYFDENSKEPDFSDARECSITELVPNDVFERDYPDAISSEVSTGTGDEEPMQAGEGFVRVAEYFWVEHKPRTLMLLPDGRTIWEDEASEDDLALVTDPMLSGDVKTRKVKSRCVYWAKVTANAVLEGPTKLPVKYIPVVPLCAREVMVGNDKYTFGLVRFSRDPMAEYNYMRSKNVELVALSPKAPMIGTKRMFEGFEPIWARANHESRAYLPFNADTQAPNMKPERIQPPNAGGSIMADSLQSLEDIKSVMGIPDARMGMRSNEQSGVAIDARRRQSETATYEYLDNVRRANEQLGRILVDWIPYVYDSERVVRVRGKDGTYQDATINQVVGPGEILNDLTTGKYDVTVSVGPSFTSQREESRAFMLDYFRADPDAAPMFRDLVFKNSDFSDAEEMAERARRMLPPGLTGEPVQPPPPDPMQANAAVEAEARARKMMADAEMAELNTHKATADVAAYAMDQAAGMPPQMPAPAGP